ncbi:MAG: PAS domain S-box protein, partial [Melioribacteraceae bacterium]
EKYIQAIVRDISARKKTERALEKRSRIEKTIGEISSTFINIPVEKIDSSIALAIKKIVTLTSADEGVLFLFSNDNEKMKLHFSWSRDTETEIEHDIEFNLSNLKWWGGKILNKQIVSVSKTSSLPREAEFEKKYFQKAGIYSIIDIPLIYQQKVIGVLGFNSKKLSLEFDDEEVSLLNMFGQIIVNALQRKKTELSLLESEERLELALKGADLGLWDWNIQNGEITYNENWAKILGYKLNEIKPRFETWQKLVHNEDYKKVRTALNNHLKGKTEFYEAEYRMLTKSGKWKWMLDKGKVFERDKNDKALRAAGTTLDITDKKNFEEALIRSEERFRSLFENSAFGIYQTSVEGKIELCNNAFLEIFGYESLNELIDKEVSKNFYVYPKDRERFLTVLFTKGKINGHEIEYKNSKGKRVYVREYARIVNINGRNIIEGAVENITKNKLAELELVKAKEKAEESDKLKSEFLAQMSHEIRTPINTVLSFAGLLKDELSGKLARDLEDSFSVMNRAGRRIIRTIDLLLDMSQMQTGTYEINLKKIDVCEKILKDISDEYKYIAKEKNLNFEIVKQNEENFITGDEYTVGQILHNLIDNAIKYTN